MEWAWLLGWLIIILGSLVLGIVVTLLVEWYIFQKYLTTLPPAQQENTDPSSSEFTSFPSYNLPEVLIEALRNSGLGLPGELLESVKLPSSGATGDGCCLALNLVVQFVFRELRSSEMVRRWFLKKLNLEFEELVTRTTTGKLFERVSIRDIDLGVEAPIIRRAWVRDVQLHSPHKSPVPGASQSPLLNSLDVGLSLLYAGGFRIVTRANMVLGRTAHLSIEVCRLSGECVLSFRRRPYAHWSLAFVGEPHLDLNVRSLFQGRSLSQVSTLITSQIRKALRKKHTLPNFKMRHKPFLPRDEVVDDESNSDLGGVGSEGPTTLEVAVLEASRLPENPLGGSIQITLALDCAAWIHLSQTGSATTATIDIKVNRIEGLGSSVSLKPSISQSHQPSQIKVSQQPLGLVFRPIHPEKRTSSSTGSDLRRSLAVVVIDSVTPGSPCALAGVHPGDALISIDGKKITSLSQAARIIKNAGESFTMRVERKSRSGIPNLGSSTSASSLSKCENEKPVDRDPDLLSSVPLTSTMPMSTSLPSSPAPKRGKVDSAISSTIGPTVIMSQLCSDSDGSGNVSSIIPGAPSMGKRASTTLEEPSVGMRRNRSSSLPKSRGTKLDEETDVSGSRLPSEDRKSRGSILQMKSTRELNPDEVIPVGEAFTFQVHDRHRFLNINVWGLPPASGEKKTEDAGTPNDGSEIVKPSGNVVTSGGGILRQRRRSSDPPSSSSMSSSSSSSSLSAGGKGVDSSFIVCEDGDKAKVLLAHLCIPIQSLLGLDDIEEMGELDRHLRCWSLQPPDPFSPVGVKYSDWTSHSGFDPNLCFGDILLTVSLTTESKSQSGPQSVQSVKSFAKRGWRSKQDKDVSGAESMQLNKDAGADVEDDESGEKLTKDNKPLMDESPGDGLEHDFVRTQFHRATLCDFCGKKIWLKDADRCRRCSMACHKKCVAKCKSVSRCPWGGQRVSSMLTPEIVTTVEGPSEEDEDDDGDVEEGIDVDEYGVDGDSTGNSAAGSGRTSNTPTPQRIRSGLGGLLASVAAAASHQASRGLRRAGSAQNLAPGGAQGGSGASSMANASPSPTAPSPPSTPALTLSPSPNSPSSNSTSSPSLLLLLSRSLPPSPQHSPTASRKTSLAESPFHLPAAIRKSKVKSDSSCDVVTTSDSDGIANSSMDETTIKVSLENDAIGNENGELSNKEEVDDEGELVQEAMEKLIQQHPRLLLQSREDEEAAMGEAKAAGKSLFSSLSPKKRREKIGKMIAKLEDAMDQEVKSRQDGGREGGRGQVLSILMLHACSGLQHAQDEEEKERQREMLEARIESKEPDASCSAYENIPASSDQ
ncbi:PDZ domain-containing protein 8 isoform X2 [Ischnura elegans]|uniref:PDZ domain-containing protein 8 isoform X2 n=1 Tax=Ischnura elegans TaxID=197161 RepID=UPI001ED8AA64|nr:PDZ domain-containing protein 8 isoform X2 [Ischnura elegans]